jgi:hypothetical protein
MLRKILLIFLFGFFISQNTSLTAMNDEDVIVHIWRPTSKRWGHVSLETKNYYMSLQPKNGKKLTSASEGTIVTDLKADIYLEAGEQDANYVLNSDALNCDLSVSKINSKFEEFLSFNEISLDSCKGKSLHNLPYSQWACGGVLEEDQDHYWAVGRRQGRQKAILSDATKLCNIYT